MSFVPESVWPDASVTVVGLSVEVIPRVAELFAVSVIVPLNVFMLVRLIVAFSFFPGSIWRVFGLDVMLKSGLITVTVMKTECLSVPLVPVTLIA